VWKGWQVDDRDADHHDDDADRGGDAGECAADGFNRDCDDGHEEGPRVDAGGGPAAERGVESEVDEHLAADDRPPPAQPIAPSSASTSPTTSWEPCATLPGSARMTSSTPPNPMTSPIARSLVIDSLSAKRAITATKKGAEFSSTDATAAPARSVPTLIPICVSVVFPKPIQNARSIVDGCGAGGCR
jgi:hypothetical protein